MIALLGSVNDTLSGLHIFFIKLQGQIKIMLRGQPIIKVGKVLGLKIQYSI
tara:strand:- start:101136 stop:101288 length:153 start_codon:yes stop_codon:yes gene_type:complete